MPTPEQPSSRSWSAPTRGSANQGSPFEELLARYQQLLTGAGGRGGLGVGVGVADAAWRGLDRSARRGALWADLTPVTTDVHVSKSYGRLRALATAWATPGSSLHGREAVAEAVLGALHFLSTTAYHPASPELGNWYHWEIGAPRALLDSCVLLRTRMSPDDLRTHLAAVDHFCPDPDRRTKAQSPPVPDLLETGANRADKAVIVALSGLLAGDGARIALARDGLSDVRDSGRHSLFARVTSGDGLHRDGSFVQHDTVAYTGAYGTTLLTSIAVLLAVLDGSPWTVTDPGVAVVFDAVERAFAPWVFEGLMMDAVRGRGVSRQRSRDRDIGAELAGAVLLLARAAPADAAARWRALVKGWILRAGTDSFFAHAPAHAVALARELLADPAVEPAPRTDSHRVFAGMDRTVHHRSRWSAALALSSRRTATYECGNGENLHGWYTGDGMLYLYHVDDADQFGDAFWPTVDPRRLPGTTVDTRPREDVGRGSGPGTGAFPATNAFAGGAALGDRYGVSGLDFRADGSSLRARKAWFFLDEAVVALGADITATDGRTVETVVENRNLHADGQQRLTVDGLPDRGRHRFAGARWAHLEGTGGYLFPDGADLSALREARRGSWRSINIGGDTGGDETEVLRHYLTLWLDHGVSPTRQSYAYVLLPGATAAETAAADRSRPVRVLANSPEVQAVQVPALGLTAALFWQAAEAGGLSCDGPACVLVQRLDDRITVAVSDPSRTRATVRVELPWPAGGVRSADSSVRAVPGRRPVLTVTTGGSHGLTHTAELATVPTPEPETTVINR